MKIVQLIPNKDTSETLAPEADDSDLFQGEDFVDDEVDWQYQGKSRRQVEGSYRIFVLCLLAFFFTLLIWVCR